MRSPISDHSRSTFQICYHPHRTAKELGIVIRNVIKLYVCAGFVVQTALMDGELEKVKELLAFARRTSMCLRLNERSGTQRNSANASKQTHQLNSFQVSSSNIWLLMRLYLSAHTRTKRASPTSTLPKKSFSAGKVSFTYTDV